MGYAANFTPRWKVSYNSFDRDHTMTIRLPIGKTSIDVTDTNDLSVGIAALAAWLPADFAFTDSEFALEGQNFFLPALLPSTNSNHALLGYDVNGAANIGQFSGELHLEWKGSGGASSGVSIFGFHVYNVQVDTELTYRLPASAFSGGLTYRAAFVNLSVADASGVIATPSNNFTFQHNSYWEDR